MLLLLGMCLRRLRLRLLLVLLVLLLLWHVVELVGRRLHEVVLLWLWLLWLLLLVEELLLLVDQLGVEEGAGRLQGWEPSRSTREVGRRQRRRGRQHPDRHCTHTEPREGEFVAGHSKL